MRRLPLALLACSLAAVALTALAAGCGGRKDDDDDDLPARTKRSSGGGAAAATLKPVVAKDYGTLTGKVEFAGSDDFTALTESLQKDIAGNTDHNYCLQGKLPGGGTNTPDIRPYETVQQEYRVGKNKGLGNVFVWIEPEAGHHFVVPQDQLDAVEKEVPITQPHCTFMPHCSVAFPSYYKDGVQVKTGQKVVIENDAKVTHNAKVAGGPLNGESNQTLQPKKEDGSTSNKEYVFKPEKNPITVACDVHKWMRAYVRVHDHPYATATSVGADPKKKLWEDDASPAFGTYTIKGVPVGAKVKLFAWHEKLGYLTAASGDPLTLAKETKKDFTAAPK